MAKNSKSSENSFSKARRDKRLIKSKEVVDKVCDEVDTTSPDCSLPKSKIHKNEEGLWCLGEEWLWRFKAINLKHDLVKERLDSTNSKIEVYLDKYPELRELFQKKLACIKEIGETTRTISEFNTEIETIVGFSLKECAIDDDIGLINRFSPEE